MPTAIDVANFFISIGQLTDDNMTNMKINKLMYFAQGWSLAKLEKPLFEEDFEAWEYGPVLPSIYRTFKTYSKLGIDSVYGEYNAGVFSPEQLELLTQVAINYMKYSGIGLMEITHMHDSPWYTSSRNEIISKNKMKDYFQTQRLEEVRQIEIEKVGYRDERGVLVLPREFVDDWE